MQALLRAAALAATAAVCACGASHRPPPSTPPPPSPRVIAAFAMPDVIAPPPPPPFALTTPDGAPLRLSSIEARTQVRGPLASTELRMRFVNESPNVLEGRFRIVLP